MEHTDDDDGGDLLGFNFVESTVCFLEILWLGLDLAPPFGDLSWCNFDGFNRKFHDLAVLLDTSVSILNFFFGCSWFFIFTEPLLQPSPNSLSMLSSMGDTSISSSSDKRRLLFLFSLPPKTSSSIVPHRPFPDSKPPANFDSCWVVSKPPSLVAVTPLSFFDRELRGSEFAHDKLRHLLTWALMTFILNCFEQTGQSISYKPMYRNPAGKARGQAAKHNITGGNFTDNIWSCDP